MGQSDQVDQRLEELEQELDREAAAARRAVDSPEDAFVSGGAGAPETTKALVPSPADTSLASRAKRGGLTFLALGLGIVVAGKVFLPLLLAPLLGAFWLARLGLRLALLGAAGYGAWSLWAKLSSDKDAD